MINLMEEVRAEVVGSLKNALSEIGVEDIEVIPEEPKERQFGDLSSNVAMAAARSLKRSPHSIAEEIVSKLNVGEGIIDRVEIAGAGFINFYLKRGWLCDTLAIIERMGDRYGSCDKFSGKSVMVEYISANPTGPMHMGNARGGALGDGIAALLERVGYRVCREFYLNDAGNQIEKFASSLEARYMQLFGDFPFPEDGYLGNDIIALAEGFRAIHGERCVSMESSERKRALVEYALPVNLRNMEETLRRYRIEYDSWYKESSLYASGEVEGVVRELLAMGQAYEKEGATWLRCSEKDEVLVRANGIPTYFAADIAYHLNKLKTRSFDLAINVWGADHHGHIARMKEAISYFGVDPERLHVVTMQLVRLLRDGQPARMSKRTGEAITLGDLLDDIGVDAARFFFNMRLANSHFDFDLDLAARQTNENPVYYVQYAHARICSMLKKLAEDGVGVKGFSEINASLLTQKEEVELLRALASFPDEVLTAARELAPSRMTRYAMDLAALFHSFYNAQRVMGEEPELMNARVKLVDSVRVVLANVLDILKVDAPQSM